MYLTLTGYRIIPCECHLKLHSTGYIFVTYCICLFPFCFSAKVDINHKNCENDTSRGLKVI